MEPTPLTRPQHLRPAAPSWLTWIVQRLAGAIAAVLGLASFIVVAVMQPALWATPDWRLTVPGLVATAIATAVSIARREPGAYPLWLIGLGLAGAALVLGWFLVLAIVIAATVVLILVLHALM
ncbi:MAG: hypothetical protein ACREBE_09330 [bacterium]